MMTSRLNIGILILLFAITALPFAATFAFYYPDERHYSDSAIGILKDHDWMAPRTARGELRTQKPPMTCWAIAASYAALGTSALAERLPFLLAGCATLLLTYRIAKRLTGKKTPALIAAAVLASHPQFFLSCTRGMPDALQMFFMTLSLYGFLRLIVFSELTPGAFWMAYGGAALTFQSKGLFGIAIILFAWAYAGLQARDWRAVTRIIHGPGLIVFLICSLGWFAYILWRFPGVGFHIFFADQVTGNVRGHWWLFLVRPFVYAGILLLNFLPWSLPVSEWLLRRKFKFQGTVPAGARRFILAWLGLVFVFLTCCENVSLRYLLPATPLLAVLIADGLENMAVVKLIFTLRRILACVLAALTLTGAVCIWIVSQWPETAWLIAALAILMLATGWVAWKTLFQPEMPPAEGVMLAVFFLCLTVFAATMPVLLPSRATQMADTLKQSHFNIDRKVLFIGSIQMGSRLRVELGPEWQVIQRDWIDPEFLKQFKTVLIPEKWVGRFAQQRWQIQQAALEPGAPPAGTLIAAIKNRQLPEALLLHSQRYYLASHP